MITFTSLLSLTSPNWSGKGGENAAYMELMYKYLFSKGGENDVQMELMYKYSSIPLFQNYSIFKQLYSSNLHLFVVYVSKKYRKNNPYILNYPYYDN